MGEGGYINLSVQRVASEENIEACDNVEEKQRERRKQKGMEIIKRQNVPLR